MNETKSIHWPGRGARSVHTIYHIFIPQCVCVGVSRKHPSSILQCMKVKSESEVAQLCPTLSDPMDWSPPGSSIHGIFQARVLEWGATAFSIDKLDFIKIKISTPLKTLSRE